MCCNDKIFFQIDDINNDLIQSVNGVPVIPASAAKDFVYNQAGFDWWIEKDTAGFPVLCTTGVQFQNVEIGVIPFGGGPIYIVVRRDFGKAHPDHRPK